MSILTADDCSLNLFTNDNNAMLLHMILVTHKWEYKNVLIAYHNGTRIDSR